MPSTRSSFNRFITAQDVESHVHALELVAVPTQRGAAPTRPIRFVPFEKISMHYKLMMAFDALVLWKASGQMPTKERSLRIATTILRLRLDTLIHEVQSLVGEAPRIAQREQPTRSHSD